MYHPLYTFVWPESRPLEIPTHHPMYDVTAEPRSRNRPAGAILSVHTFVTTNPSPTSATGAVGWVFGIER